MPVPNPTTFLDLLTKQGVQPHSHTHERDGTDPVISDIIYHGAVTLANNFATANETLTDVTDFNMTINAKGGTLMIMMSGKREPLNSGPTGATMGGSIGTAVVVGSTVLAEYEDGFGIALASGTLSAVSITTTGTQTWIFEPSPNRHVVKVQIRCTPTTGTESVTLSAGAILQVFELLPKRA